MNYLYLSITAIVILLTAFVIVRSIKDSGDNPFLMIGFVIGAFASMILSLLSFIAPTGIDVVTNTTEFRVETTEYRIIVAAAGQERTYTGAYYVKNFAKIKSVEVTTRYNAWGINLPNETNITPIFEK
jgi:hypothetical protein